MAFFELKSDEKIIMTLRRHWFVLMMVVLKLVPLFLLPLIIGPFISPYFVIGEPLMQKSFWLITSLWWLFVWAGMAILWVNYYLDYWVVTNQRVISTYQTGLFRREVSELSFSRIQDLTVTVKGLLKTFINYGNLEIRTAGTFDVNQQDNATNVFIFRDIPYPYEVQNTLSKIHHDFVKENGK